MNRDLDRLQPYPFERLATLLDAVEPASLSPIALSIGEPRHPPPTLVLDALTDALGGVARYPATKGDDALREAMADWLGRRFGLPVTDALARNRILPLNGTREGLFAIAQCLLDRTAKRRQVLMPNPFYQIYEGAALLAGCEPAYYTISANADADIDAIRDDTLAAAQLIFICTPGNPTGAVLSSAAMQRLIARAIEHEVVVVSDECYAEIYRETATPPPSLLQSALEMGNTEYRNCLVFHSLSKRSNLPGMRSGFVAGDARFIAAFLRYRTYHGCAMPPPVQAASIAAWCDDAHVAANRLAYDRKFTEAVPLLSEVMEVAEPDAGFYLWPTLDDDIESFTRELLARANVRVLPGHFLARDTGAAAANPGLGHLRLALVATPEDCLEGVTRIRDLALERKLSRARAPH
ncbi:MAG: succinyldiaminopimelate transaminase [Gammaproteobacteria bacterium]|nr:MAG: succinyldiaminopimelate transaminase [Gammaproteobacteria bacterium]